MVDVLVTGTAGFIGANLALNLVEHGTEVRGIDNFETGHRDNLTELCAHPKFEFVEGDIRDPDDVEQAIRGVTVIYHQAAVPSVPRSVDDPRLSTEANCVGTANLIAAARDNDVETLVSASSSSVYGSSEELPKHESMPPHPESPYALSKYFTEQLTVQASALYGIQAVALRYFNVFGPRQDPRGPYAAVIPKFINTMLAGERPVIYGDGEQSRDFTYIDNVVAANIAAAQSDVSGEVFNIACGDRTTVNELVGDINEILDATIAPVYADPRPGDVRHSHADISKASEQIGYEPAIPYRDGLERTIRWLE